jgi:glucose-6-phosphate isomerase
MLKLKTKNATPAQTFKKYEPRLKKAKESLLKRKYADFLYLPNQDILPLIKLVTPLKNKFTDVVIVGMGGSILGAQMLFHTLQKPHTTSPRIHFVDNIDPNLIASFEEPLNRKKTLFLLVSKTGNTLETTTIFDLIHKGAKKWFGKNWRNHITIITENKDGILYKKALKDDLLVFPMPKYVGGRYSVLTTAGLVPAILMGIDVKSLLKGAESAQKSKTATTLAVLIHQMYTQKKKTTLALFPYIDCFEYFNKWTIQLIAESLGKNSRIGPLPVGMIGAKDQHSTLQLLLDGPKDKWVLFFELEKYTKDYIANGTKYSEILKAQKKGTEGALTKKRVPNASLSLEKLNAENLGELIFTFEAAVALAGEMLGVNPFNQPAVELGKRITKKLLSK